MTAPRFASKREAARAVAPLLARMVLDYQAKIAAAEPAAVCPTQSRGGNASGISSAAEVPPSSAAVSSKVSA